MSLIKADSTFNALAITDTNLKTGSTITLDRFQVKTIMVENGLNQTVTIQCQASSHADFSNPVDVGSTFNVSATTNSYQTCDDYFPYMRATAQCSQAPASGTLTVEFIQHGD